MTRDGAWPSAKKTSRQISQAQILAAIRRGWCKPVQHPVSHRNRKRYFRIKVCTNRCNAFSTQYRRTGRGAYYRTYRAAAVTFAVGDLSADIAATDEPALHAIITRMRSEYRW